MHVRVLILAALLVGGGAIVQAQLSDEKVVVYAHAESVRRGGGSDVMSVSFYPDGLVETYLFGGDENSSGGASIQTSFTVRRSDDGFELKYAKSGRYYEVARCERTLKGVKIRIKDPDAGGLVSLDVVREEPSRAGRVTYRTISGSDTYRAYTFYPDRTVLDLVAAGEKYTFRLDPRSDTPIVETSGDKTFTFTKQAGGTTLVEYKTVEGMPLWTFTIKGTPRHVDPLIAVLNLELVFWDFVTPVPVFPYIGGSPGAP